MTDRLVWIDCEMTGLDLTRDALIEIACLVTDSELVVLDEGLDLIIKPPAEAIDQMEDVVREMHTSSGLLAELPAGITLAERRTRCWHISAGTSASRGGYRWPATPSPPTAPSSPATCRNSTRSCTTGWSTYPASRSWPAAGTRGPTSPARPSAAATGPW